MSKYETTRATALETGITAGSNTSRETKQEYSAPFGSHSVCPHLITGFTISGVTVPSGQDDPNTAYTVTRPYIRDGGVGSANILYATGTNGHEFSADEATGSAITFFWSFFDADFNPFATGKDGTSDFGSGPEQEYSLANFDKNQWKYDYTFPWFSGITWTDPNMSGITFSNFIGGDI